MKHVIVCALLLITFLSNGQIKEQKEIGTYDPSFWKKELRLNKFQYNRMCEINHEFYDKLVIAFRSLKNDRQAFRLAFAECWTNRNTQLLQTMNEHQQKKWNRIMSNRYSLENLQASWSENGNLPFYYVSE